MRKFGPLIIVAASAIAVAGTSHLAAEPLLSEKVGYYDVTGTTAREVRINLDRLGPVSKSDGKRYDADTTWKINWRYRYKESSAGCAIGTVSVEVATTITIPRLTGDAPSDLKAKFDSYSEKLMGHERGHAQNAIGIAKRIEQAINTLPPVRSCPELEVSANGVGQALIKEANKADIDYDARIGHGRTQGAVFP